MYFRNAKRMIELELEYVTPDAHLFLANIKHGILGHPRKLYDTMLQLNRDAVRNEKFTLDYDPYQLIVQPFLVVPDPIASNTEYVYHKQFFPLINICSVLFLLSELISRLNFP